jgi:uncharacterized protein YndB with AHSA1/START domain/ketosteroid isomerase-like protein
MTEYASRHQLRIAAPPERVFDLLTTESGLRRWWTASTAATPEPGAVLRFGFDGDTVMMHFRVDRHDRARALTWTCVDNPKSPREWVDTKIVAELEPDGDGTVLRFGHIGWAKDDGALPLCNTTWGALMHRLRDAAEGRDRGPLFGPSAREIVRAYHDAWTTGKLDLAAERLSPNVDFQGPIDRFDRAEPFLAELAKLQPIIRSVELLGELERGDEVCLRYQLITAVPAIGTTEVAEWFRVKDGRIATIRLYFDPRPYVAMFAAPPSGSV